MIIILLFIISSVHSLTNSKYHVWLDTDPGIDDAFAIALAATHPSINLIGISSASGNIQLQKTSQNALDLLSALNRTDIDVFMGMRKEKGNGASYIHGANGLGGVILPHSRKKLIKENSRQKIKQLVLKQKEKVILIAVGPLTNWCQIFKQYPEVKENIEKILIMGGAIGKGNVSPAAEFNMYSDPLAAECLFKEKGTIPLTMIPLQVTLKVTAGENVFHFLQGQSHPFAKSLFKMLKTLKYTNKKYDNIPEPAIHDPTVVYYMLRPEQFTVKETKVVIDTYPTSFGRTNCYIKGYGRETISSIDRVGVDIEDKEKFWQEWMKVMQDFFEKDKV